MAKDMKSIHKKKANWPKSKNITFSVSVWQKLTEL